MNRTALIFLAILMTLLGCGRSRLSPEDAPATITLDRSFGFPELWISEADGSSLKSHLRSWQFEPGSHELLISEKVRSRVRSQEPEPLPQALTVNLAAGQAYVLRGRREAQSDLTCIRVDERGTNKTVAFTTATCKTPPNLPPEAAQRERKPAPVEAATTSSPRSLPAFDRSCSSDSDCISAAEAVPRCFQHCRESACEGEFVDTCQVFNRYANFAPVQCVVSAICKKPKSVACVQGVCSSAR